MICRYRLNEEKAEWIIYVTDVGQREHFEMLFAVSLNVLCALDSLLFSVSSLAWQL